MTTQLVPFETDCDRLQDGSVRLVAHGELDLATASALAEALAECARDDPSCVVVDLADVPFIDASGLRVLLAARRERLQEDGDLVIARPSAQVRRLLDIAAKRAELPVISSVT